MAEETINPEEEYNFSPLESSDVFGEGKAGPERPAMPTAMKIRRNILFVIGVIFVLFATYKVLTAVFSPKKVSEKVEQAKVTEVQPTTTPTQISDTSTDELNKKVSTLQEQHKTQQSSVDQLNEELSAIKDALQSHDKWLSDMDASIKNLSKAVAAQQKQLQAMQVKETPVVQRPVYYLQAAIPGRAWIASDEGVTRTVSVGDEIAGYGSVQSIEPHLGRVIMSTGDVIQTNPDDR